MTTDREKADLRRIQKRDRMSLTEIERQVAESAICAYIGTVADRLRKTRCVAYGNGSHLGVIGLYAAVQGEVDIFPCFSSLLATGWRIAFPRVRGEGWMDMHDVGSLNCLTKGAYGIHEPMPDTPIVTPEQIDVLLVPGLAFTPFGFRLGYGGGYYDRFLSRSTASPITLGIAFSRQMIDSLPVGRHDRRMRYVITEQGVFDCCTGTLRLS